MQQVFFHGSLLFFIVISSLLYLNALIVYFKVFLLFCQLPVYPYMLSVIFNSNLRNEKHPLDRPGDVDPHQHVGWRQDSAGAERSSQDWTHFLHHIQQHGRPGLLPNTGAVPNKTEEAEIKFQAMLPKQVCMLTARKNERKRFRVLLIYCICLFSFLLSI